MNKAHCSDYRKKYFHEFHELAFRLSLISNHQKRRYKKNSIQMKCQGGNKYALSITVKFDQSTRRFGRISYARLFKFTKHIALLFYLLSPYILPCMRGSRNIRTNMHIIKTIMKFCAHWSTVCVWRSPTPAGFELRKPGLCCASEANI